MAADCWCVAHLLLLPCFTVVLLILTSAVLTLFPRLAAVLILTYLLRNRLV